jgi:hypothetical protein
MTFEMILKWLGMLFIFFVSLLSGFFSWDFFWKYFGGFLGENGSYVKFRIKCSVVRSQGFIRTRHHLWKSFLQCAQLNWVSKYSLVNFKFGNPDRM